MLPVPQDAPQHQFDHVWQHSVVKFSIQNKKVKKNSPHNKTTRHQPEINDQITSIAKTYGYDITYHLLESLGDKLWQNFWQKHGRQINVSKVSFNHKQYIHQFHLCSQLVLPAPQDTSQHCIGHTWLHNVVGFSTEIPKYQRKWTITSSSTTHHALHPALLALQLWFLEVLHCRTAAVQILPILPILLINSTKE